MKKTKICEHTARKLYEKLTHGIEDIKPWGSVSEYIRSLYRHEASRLKSQGK